MDGALGYAQLAAWLTAWIRWQMTMATDPSTLLAAASEAHVPTPPSERGAWLLALALGVLGVGVLVAVLTGVVGRTTHGTPTPLPPTVLVAAVDTDPRGGRLRGACSPGGARNTVGGGCAADAARRHARGDRRATVARAAARGGGALRRSDRNAHHDALDGRLLPDLRHRAAHVRRQLAADRVDPRAGVGVLDGPHDLPRAELRRLLRRADAVQRDERRGGHPIHVGPRQRLLSLRQTPGGV